MLNINKSNLSVPNVLIYYQPITLSNINSINEQLPSKLLFLTKKIVAPSICNNPDNFHLEEHFKENGYIVSKLNKTEKLTYGGKFNVSGSIFETANNVLDLLDTPMDNKIIIVATYDVEKANKNFKNYVFYIYDYKNYGFVKTGDVYSKLDNKWHPAYALMFVTDENDNLVTVHPRYM